jgi:hypothetical protein
LTSAGVLPGWQKKQLHPVDITTIAKSTATNKLTVILFLIIYSPLPPGKPPKGDHFKMFTESHSLYHSIRCFVNGKMGKITQKRAQDAFFDIQLDDYRAK